MIGVRSLHDLDDADDGRRVGLTMIKKGEIADGHGLQKVPRLVISHAFQQVVLSGERAKSSMENADGSDLINQ